LLTISPPVISVQILWGGLVWRCGSYRHSTVVRRARSIGFIVIVVRGVLGRDFRLFGSLLFDSAYAFFGLPLLDWTSQDRLGLRVRIFIAIFTRRTRKISVCRWRWRIWELVVLVFLDRALWAAV
jgi:hypothetical protein